MPREERLAIVSDRIDFEAMHRHLLLHLAPPRTVTAQTELAAAAAVAAAHAEVGIARETHGAAASAQQVAPRILLPLRPPRRPPAPLLARRLRGTCASQRGDVRISGPARWGGFNSVPHAFLFATHLERALSDSSEAAREGARTEDEGGELEVRQHVQEAVVAQHRCQQILAAACRVAGDGECRGVGWLIQRVRVAAWAGVGVVARQ